MADFDDDQLLIGAFAEFRTEATPFVNPAGTAAAHETVRYRKRVRTIAATTLAALLVVGPVAAYAAVNGEPHGPPAQTAASQDASGSAPASPSAQPPASASPSPAASASTAPTVPALAGQVFYQDLSSGALVTGGKRYPGGPVLNLNVSPDGKHVSWVDERGNLLVSDLNGANAVAVDWGVDGTCVEPVWSGDSTRVLGNKGTTVPYSGELTVMELSGLGTVVGAPNGCHYRWSADGKRTAVLHGDLSGITVSNLDGSRKSTITRSDLGNRVISDLASISSDGGRICLAVSPAGSPGGDVARNLACNTIVDTATRKEVRLPVAGELTAAVFQPDGGVLLRVKSGGTSTLVLLDNQDRVVARSVESPANAKLGLLSYTG